MWAEEGHSRDGLCRGLRALSASVGGARGTWEHEGERRHEGREGGKAGAHGVWSFLGNMWWTASPKGPSNGRGLGRGEKGEGAVGSPRSPAMLGSRLRASRAMGSSHRVSAISRSALGEQGRQGGCRSGPGRVLTGLESCVPPQLGARPDPCHPLALVNLPCRLWLLWPVEETSPGSCPPRPAPPGTRPTFGVNPRKVLMHGPQPGTSDSAFPFASVSPV